MNTQKLAQLQKLSESVRTGGKGSVRRKKKVVRHGHGNDTNLQATLKRSNLQTLQVDEVNMFREDGKVLQFNGPKLQVNPQANTYVVSGKSEVKDASAVQSTDYAAIQRMLADLKAKAPAGGAAKDDDIPDVDVDFDTTAKSGATIEEVKAD